MFRQGNTVCPDREGTGNVRKSRLTGFSRVSFVWREKWKRIPRSQTWIASQSAFLDSFERCHEGLSISLFISVTAEKYSGRFGDGKPLSSA